MAAAQVVAQRGVVAVGHTVQACGGIGLKDPRDLESNLFSVAERLECQKPVVQYPSSQTYFPDKSQSDPMFSTILS